MFDVILMGIAAVLQLGVTIYAVDISVRDNRKRNAVVIAVAGGLAVLLTVWAGYDAYISQESLTAEVKQIRQQLSGATVTLWRVELDPPIQQPALTNNIRVLLAMGVSQGIAKSMQCTIGSFTLPGNVSAEQNRTAMSRLRKAIASGESMGEDIPAGKYCYFQTLVKVNKYQVAEMVAKNRSVKRILYAMGHAQWKNDAGADFHIDVCKWMEPPTSLTFINAGWHDCLR